MSHRQALKDLRAICKGLGIKSLSIHSLRHSHASLLLYEGLDVQYVSKRLGHASTLETLRTYAHVLDEMKEEQTEQLENVLDNL